MRGVEFAGDPQRCKTAPPKGFEAKTGPLSTKPLACAARHTTRGVGGQIIPFLTRTRMAGTYVSQGDKFGLRFLKRHMRLTDGLLGNAF